jgi:hypothetical protein
MLPRLDKKAHDSLLAECLGSLKAVQTFNEHETRSIGRTRIGVCRPLSSMLIAISSTRFCSTLPRRLTGT